MGASEWAGRMVKEIKEEFDVSEERACRPPDLVRKMVSDPHFEELREAGMVENRFSKIFINNLIGSLNARHGETVEARWNNLVKEFGLYELAGEEILLYDPVSSGFDLNQTLIANDGKTTTPRKVIDFETKELLPVEETEEGLLVDGILFRPEQPSKMSREEDSEEDTEPSRKKHQLSLADLGAEEGEIVKPDNSGETEQSNRTEKEEEILAEVAERKGEEWVEAHKKLILDQARLMGQLRDQPEE